MRVFKNLNFPTRLVSVAIVWNYTKLFTRSCYTVKMAQVKIPVAAAGKIFRRYRLPVVSTGYPRKFTSGPQVNYPFISLRHYYNVVKDI